MLLAPRLPAELTRTILGVTHHAQGSTKGDERPMRIDQDRPAFVERVQGSFDDAVSAAALVSEALPIDNAYGSGTAVGVLQALDGSTWIAPLNHGFTPNSALRYHGDTQTFRRLTPALLAVVGRGGEVADLRAVESVIRSGN